MNEDTRPPPARTGRRQMLKTLGALPVVGALSSLPASGEPRKAAAASAQNAVIVTPADAREHARLKALDLDHPEVVARRKTMPAGKIGGLSIGRVICGSNLISMNMHARDLGYVSSLARHYNTEERIFMTLKKCEELGIDSIVLKNHNFRQFKLSRYWEEWGGRMRWIADVITTDIDKFEGLLEEHLELGAS
ncbi:MAG: hypothetical protein JXA90_14235, partial [Planctomycetes bacterium]|nr:hypothetical protein [Planctomycetota bacterium]